MARKALNKTNLVELGADALAELLLEVTKGNGAAQRRLRMALSAQMGPKEVAQDVRKRFASIRRATSFVSRKRQKTLAKELTDLLDLIETGVAPDAPDLAFELLWSFLQLGAGIHERTDDSQGTMGTVMRDGMARLKTVAPNLSLQTDALVEQMLEAVAEDGFGVFDGVVPALAAHLGQDGLVRLKDRALAWESAAPSDADMAPFRFGLSTSDMADAAREAKSRTVSILLQDIADELGDVDLYMARYTAEQRLFRTIAPRLISRLLAAGRADEALALAESALERAARTPSWGGAPDLDAAYLACLDATGRKEALTTFLWAQFHETLDGDALRRILKDMPDFDDLEAEEQAKAYALAFPDVVRALQFLIEWPDLHAASKLVEARADGLDGDDYEILTVAADALRAAHPLAAVLVWRTMIVFALDRRRPNRYRYAAQHLLDCVAADAEIEAYGAHPDHAEFMAALRKTHASKSRFWSLVDAV